MKKVTVSQLLRYMPASPAYCRQALQVASYCDDATYLKRLDIIATTDARSELDDFDFYEQNFRRRRLR